MKVVIVGGVAGGATAAARIRRLDESAQILVFERSGYQKFAQAASSFKAFTMDWYRCTWASMNLCLAILPTTLLGTLPMGIYLYQTGVLDPAQVTLCLMMALGIVAPLMSATAFINSMKSMQFAVKDTRELLNLPQLSQVKQDAPLDDCNIQLKDVSFSYGGSDGKEVLRHLNQIGRAHV